MRYLDANVLLYAALDDGPAGRRAQDAVRAALAGDGACTSSLTLDEILWVVKRRLKDKARAADIVRKLLRTAVLVVPVERRDVDAALALFEGGLDPRDAIHAAVALRHGCSAFVSDDPAFARVPGLHATPFT